MSSNQFQPDNTMPGLDLKLFFLFFCHSAAEWKSFIFTTGKTFLYSNT